MSKANSVSLTCSDFRPNCRDIARKAAAAFRRAYPASNVTYDTHKALLRRGFVHMNPELDWRIS